MMSGGRFQTNLSSCRGRIPLCRKLLTGSPILMMSRQKSLLLCLGKVIWLKMLYHQPGEGRAEQLVVPKNLREQVLGDGPHDSLGRSSKQHQEP